MIKSAVLLCVAFCVVTDARPWQFLPAKPGYVPVYIQTGDTPLEDINPELAEAFHGPAGRSVSKQIDASPEEPDREELPEVSEDKQVPSEVSEVSDVVDRRPYEKKDLEKNKKVISVSKPIERR